MLKPSTIIARVSDPVQPPSGGCVLKHDLRETSNRFSNPAAFGRLCVETGLIPVMPRVYLPAAFGRLCVETALSKPNLWEKKPAAFGRLCVETDCQLNRLKRLICQPPSGGCVLKPLRNYLPADSIASRLRAAVC